MADSKPEIGDRVLYRGRYREVIGWMEEGEAGRQVTDDRTPIIAYQNPETGRNTYSREGHLQYSEHFGAWYPKGLLLSRAECVAYAALPGLPGGDVPQAGQHERAARMLAEEEIKLGGLSEEDRERVDRKIEGYWGESDEEPGPEEVFREARQMVEHRENTRTEEE